MLRKNLDLEQCEIKFSQDKSRAFEGYASVFGGVDSYGDTIVRGAYADSLKARRPMMYYGHNPGRVIGKWTHVAEDSKGLVVAGELTPGHTDAENVYASLKHGALNGLSIGFTVPEGGQTLSEDGSRRTLSKINLFEVSVVSAPADESARIDLTSVKSAIDAIQSVSDLEDFLRDAGGFSRNAAKTLLTQLKTVYLREAGAEIEEAKRLRELLVKAETRALLAELRSP